MSSQDSPYDPYIPSGQQAATQQQGEGGASKVEDIQANLEATRQGLQANVINLQKRGQNLDQLQDKTDNLAVSAQGFRRGANRVRKQMWWKDMKMRVCLIVGIVILLLIIIVPAVVATR